jgi:hypothetical protein
VRSYNLIYFAYRFGIFDIERMYEVGLYMNYLASVIIAYFVGLRSRFRSAKTIEAWSHQSQHSPSLSSSGP